GIGVAVHDLLAHALDDDRLGRERLAGNLVSDRLAGVLPDPHAVLERPAEAPVAVRMDLKGVNRSSGRLGHALGEGKLRAQWMDHRGQPIDRASLAERRAQGLEVSVEVMRRSSQAMPMKPWPAPGDAVEVRHPRRVEA